MSIIPVQGSLAVVKNLHEQSPRAAQMLVTLGLFEALADQADVCRPTLEPVLLEQVAKINATSRSALLRQGATGVSKGGDLLAADGLSVVDDFVTKALFGSRKEFFNRQHPRGEGGRFIRVDVAGTDANVKGLPRMDSAHVEGSSVVQGWLDSGLVKPDTPINLHYARVDSKNRTGSETDRPVQTTPGGYVEHVRAMRQANPDQLLRGVSVARKNVVNSNAKQQAALDLVALMGGQDAAGSQRILRGSGVLDDKGDAKSGGNLAQDWNAPSQGGQSQDRQAYRRMAITGRALSSMSAPGSIPHVAGGFAQLVGDLGPEAEKVLGPGIRRTAYRYRGTERRPERALTTGVADANQAAAAIASAGGREYVAAQQGANVERSAAQSNVSRGGAARGASPAAKVASMWATAQVSEDERAMRMRGDTTTAVLLGAAGVPSVLPSKELTDLSVASGELPPSQGVIIDARGKVVSQAVGFNGDHYLPFDLRNLGSLAGGQYVRTRAAGGPTTEDVYTGLLTGARMVQVVSNSGVYTLEFDPDLRGVRRYNDKVRRMITRYGEMLEAINDKGLYQQDLSPESMTQAREQAANASSSPEEYQANLKTVTDRMRVKASLNDVDDEELEQGAANYANAKIKRDIQAAPGGMSPQQRAAGIEDYKREYKTKHGPEVRQLKLDGPGYDRALRTLQQEFPYFIRRAEWEPLPQWLGERDLSARPKNSVEGYRAHYTSDRGHVKAGQTNPSALNTGVRANRAVSVRPSSGGAPEEASPTAGPAAVRSPEQRPQAAARPAGEAGAPALDVNALFSPGGKLHAQMSNTARNLVGWAALVLPANGGIDAGTDAEAMTQKPYDYANWKAHQLFEANPRNPGSATVNWLLSAPDSQRMMFLDGLHDLEHQVQLGHEGPGVPTAAEVRSAYESLTDLLDLRDPYAPAPEGGDQVMAEPDELEARPQAFPGVPKLGEPLEAFEHAAAQAGVSNPEVTAALTDMDGMSPDDMADTVADARQRVLAGTETTTPKAYAQLAAKQFAWSFLRTKELSARLRELAGVGDAAPKAEPASEPVTTSKSASSRRLVVHAPNDPFSQDVRKALGLPERVRRRLVLG